VGSDNIVIYTAIWHVGDIAGLVMDDSPIAAIARARRHINAEAYGKSSIRIFDDNGRSYDELV